MAMCGWKMSDEKCVDASERLTVIGLQVDLSPLPGEWPTIMMTTRRVESLTALVTAILDEDKMGSGQAASLAGKLGNSLSACFGRYGRCRIRPIVKRAYSAKKKLDGCLRMCLGWWLRFLHCYHPRTIPINLRALPVVLSYSDGEGCLAGIGAALWHPDLRLPLAAYTEVPTALRDHWQACAGKEGNAYRDIFLVEALGPLLLLLTFPAYLKNCLWIHFIDNSGSESALIRGSSSNVCGDHVVGLTWFHIQRRSLWTYFDRVESSANPTDGISRRRFDGPWRRVHMRPFPLEELSKFARDCGRTFNGLATNFSV